MIDIRDTGEHYITFRVSSDGKVQLDPSKFIVSTSGKIQHFLETIGPKVAIYFEDLLFEELLKE